MIYNVLPATDTGLDDKQLVPVADSTYFTESMVKKSHGDRFLEAQTGDFVICFYDADGVTPVTPTAGTVKPEMSPIDNVWMEPGVGTITIDAADIRVDSDGLSSYTIPVFVGGTKQGRVTLADIAGATYFKAEFRRFK